MEPEESPEGESYKGLWEIAERCWGQLPGDRATAQQVIQMLEELRESED